ncbi:MAG TPA: tetratricopeptide repeat protein [Chitinophagaceae bacterium]|nr:tetratricopeptide repeat protein [Chitinophagaceae bacterium]
MKIRLNITYIIFFLISLVCSLKIDAQNRYQKAGVDSAAIQKRVQSEFQKRDSIIEAARIKRVNDSIFRVNEKIKLQNYRDSLANARKEQRIKDSIERVEAKQKLLEERRIKDSIDLARKQFVKDSMYAVKLKADSIKNEQNRIRDSINVARIKQMDSIANERKRIADSTRLARIDENKKREEWTKYINSKHYKDSVETRRQYVKDSIKKIKDKQLADIKEERIRYNDSVKYAQKHIIDSISNERKRINDSTKLAIQTQNEKLRLERERYRDSLTAARESRMDSLNKIKQEKEKAIAQKEKVTNEKKKLALAIKIHDDKQKEWSNEKLLNRKWSLHRKIYQNTTSRYNYYYNAKRKYDEALTKITKNNKEDFTKPISLTPYDISKDGASISSDMDTVIKKCSFSTQIHDPRSKWFDDLFLLMGKASFAKNDYESAIATFQYVVNEYKDKKSTKGKNGSAQKESMSIATIENKKGIKKLSHHPVRNQALIWLAKSYMKAEQYGNAMSLLNILEKDPNFPANYKAEMYLAKAELELSQRENDDAIASLEKASTQKINSKQKSRVEFLLGQLYAEKEDFAKSSTHFKNSILGKNSAEMDFYTRLNIAKNASKGGGNREYAKAELHKIINDTKFQKFKSEALNTLAAIEVDDDIGKAVELLKKSIKNPENKNMYQKAIAFASLGDIYYKLSEYELAKKAYDSAAVFGTNPPIPDLANVNIRKNVLGEILSYTNTIKLNDSLLALSFLSEKDKIAAAKRELEQRKKMEAEQPAPDQLKVEQLLPINNNKKASNWYFYNKSLVEKGVMDFKQKWGNRKLEDNWRRASANYNYSVDANEDHDEDDKKSEKKDANIQALLAKIPKSPAEKDTLYLQNQSAFYNLGILYYSQLSDYYNSIKALDTLLQRYPNTQLKQKTYYALYLDYDKLNQNSLAQNYKNKLLQEFGQSELSLLANNPNYYAQKLLNENALFAHYDNAYKTYKNGNYKDALAQVEYAKSAYKVNKIQAKYDLVEALSYAGLKDYSKSKTILLDVISKYPNTSEQQRAQDILGALQTGQPLDSINNNNLPTSNGEPVVANTDPAKDSLESSKAFKELRDKEGNGNYVLSNNEEHYVMIFIKSIDGRTMALKAGLSDYNLLKSNIQDYKTNLNLLTAQQGIITIQKFSNNIFAKKYLNDLIKENKLFSQFKPNEYEVAIIHTTNFNELLSSRDILGYMKFYKKMYK